MSNQLRLIELAGAEDPLWDRCMAIYLSAFPAWEREDVDVIASRVDDGAYLVVAGLLGDDAVGFYIIDRNPAHNYAVLSFLAVDDGRRGCGWGTTLCRDAKARFRLGSGMQWMFVEAEARQAEFYGHLGFLKVAIDYAVPRYDGPGSMPMHLMVLPIADTVSSIPGQQLSDMLRHAFHNGYLLEDDDPRMVAQLARITDPVALLCWSTKT